MLREKVHEGGVHISYNNKLKKIRKKTQRKINALPRQTKQQNYPTKIQRKVFPKLKKRRIYLIGTAIPIAIFISLIIVIPSFVVQIDGDGNETTRADSTAEDPVFNEINVEHPLIEVTIQRSETDEIETIPLEQYVASVVASEMPAQFELDALKAQAIAARTYIVNHLLHEDEELISDTTNHQVYRNKSELQSLWGTDFHWKWEKINRAVAETESLIITYENEPITPTFFSMSNGYTEDAEHYWGNELPYLKSVESKWEEDLPNFVTQEVFTFAEINELLNTTIQNGSKISVKVNRTPSNRVSEVQIAEQSFSGRSIREKLNLRSTDFTIEQKNNHFIFTTKGYGHGVGMSQYGANGMAEEGKTYDEIITYYYNDVSISSITDAVPTLVADSK